MINLPEIIKNVTPEQLDKLESSLNKVVPMIEEKLPLLSNLETAWRKEFNVNERDLFLYSAIKTPDNKKIFVYVFTAFFAPEKHIFSNGRTIEKNNVIINAEIKKIELLDFLKEATNGGLSGLLDLFM